MRRITSETEFSDPEIRLPTIKQATRLPKCLRCPWIHIVLSSHIDMCRNDGSIAFV